MDRAETLHERGKLSLAEKPEINYFPGLGVLKRREGVLVKGLISHEMRERKRKGMCQSNSFGKKGNPKRIEGQNEIE